MRSICGWTATLLVVLSAPAWAQGPAGSSLAGLEQRAGARAMLYWQWSPDAGARVPAQAGLRFDVPVRLAGAARSVPVVDLGFTRTRTTLRTLGALAFDSSDPDVSDPTDSLTTETLKKPVFWVGVTAVALVVSCATGNFPCKDKDSGGSGSTSTPGASRR